MGVMEKNRTREDLRRVGSPQVKISEPVPEAEDSKRLVLSGFAGLRFTDRGRN